MNLLRPAFDAACIQLRGTIHGITVVQADALWELLVPANAHTKDGRQRFTATAHALREPLRKEIATVKNQIKLDYFANKFAIEPGKPALALAPLHLAYAARLTDILERLDAALRSNGHYCTAGDESWAQPIQVIVANERAAGRYAGMSNWTQWEDPTVVRKTQRIFAAGPKVKHGAQWSPYLSNGTRRPGAAAQKKAIGLWRGAFHDSIHASTQALAPNPDAWPLIKFYQSLKENKVQQHIEDAIQAQVAAHRSPTNPAFRNSIWLALDLGTRATLASNFNAALNECREKLLAQRRPNDVAQFDPAVVPNPWALTEDEQEFKPGAAPAATIVPLSVFEAGHGAPVLEPEPDETAGYAEGTGPGYDMLDALDKL